MLTGKIENSALPTVLREGPLESVNSVCILCLQCIPGGGGGGTSTQSTRNSRNPALLPSSHSLPERHAPKLPVLLHCSVPRRWHPLAPALHCGGQQDLQRLLERPSAASEKLQRLLPGCQHSQRGRCFWSFYFIHAITTKMAKRLVRLTFSRLHIVCCVAGWHFTVWQHVLHCCTNKYMQYTVSAQQLDDHHSWEKVLFVYLT